MNKHSRIGVFDSGFGGLSVLKSIMKLMPNHDFVYLADIAYAPYGEQPDTYIIERSKKIARFMHDQMQTQGLVIACNTATAAAIHVLRDFYAQGWPIIGTEPGLKPAAAISKRIAVMATHSTLQSAKFQSLVKQVQQEKETHLDLFLCPCNGLAKAIDSSDENLINELVERYTDQVGINAPDVLVLGCTHYSLVKDKISQALPGVHILDTGEAIARRVQSVLPEPLAMDKHLETNSPQLQVWTNGSTQELERFLLRWMPEVNSEVLFWHEHE